MPLLSICIPTFKRPEILKETVLSIFEQKVDNSLFDVCITDNSPTDETKEVYEKDLAQFANVHYKKVGCEGFMNSIEALKFGDGEFLKLHNDYSKFLPGSLQRMIDVIKSFQKDSVVFFGMNNNELPTGLTEYDNFDAFMNAIHYWSTWSSAFAIWKQDFDVVMAKNIELDRMFPHTSVLFDLIRKPKYYVDNSEYVENLPLKKKGGYNLVDNFVRLYMGMVGQLLENKAITQETYGKIKQGILLFVAQWYVNVKVYKEIYTFSFEDWENKLSTLYGQSGVAFVKDYARKHLLKARVRKILIKIQGK